MGIPEAADLAAAEESHEEVVQEAAEIQRAVDHVAVVGIQEVEKAVVGRSVLQVVGGVCLKP